MNDRASAPYGIRAATPEDFESILDLLTAVAAEGAFIATKLPFDRVARRAALSRLVTLDEAMVLVATDAANTLVGELSASPVAPGLLSLGMLVEARWRNRGVGRALLAECIAWARSIDAHKLVLEVFAENRPARALYAACGFVEEGYFRHHRRRKNGDFLDSIPMGLLLADR